MGAMKPRAGSGPLEVVREGGNFIIRIPIGHGERLVLALDAQEAQDLGVMLLAVDLPEA